jgi:hypothetical protein
MQSNNQFRKMKTACESEIDSIRDGVEGTDAEKNGRYCGLITQKKDYPDQDNVTFPSSALGQLD